MNRVAALFLFLAIAVNSVGCAAKRPTAKSDVYDRQFLRRTLDHLTHDMKIARACAGKHIRQELSTFCKDLLQDQTREHDQMSRWLQDWYQRKPPSDPFPLWIESQNGEVFERYFLKGVLEGHRDVAKRAADCTKNARHPELAEFCKEVSEHRTKEARTMEQWNCAWFKECD